MSKKKKNAPEKEPVSDKKSLPAEAVEGASVPAGGSVGTAAAMCASVLTKRERLELVLFLVFAGFACHITVGRVSNIAMLLCLIFSVRKSSFANLREHFSLPVIGFAGMLLMYGVGGIYSPFGASATLELFRGVCVFSIAAFVLLRFRKEHTQGLLWGFQSICAVIAFLSLDGGSTTILYNGLVRFAGLWGDDMTVFDAVASGTRLSGIFNNANVLAGITGMAVILGLYQLRALQCRKARFAASMLLGINGTVCWLTASRGGILCFGVSLLAYLLLTKKGERMRLFLMMLFSAGPAVLLGAVASRLLAQGSLLPDLLALVCGGVIFLLNEWVVSVLAQLLDGKTKLIYATGGAFAALCVVCVALVFTLTGPYQLDGTGMLYRQLRLVPGETYALTADWDGDYAGVSVYVENETGILMDSYEGLYMGALDGAEFTVPADAVVTHVQITGDGGEVRSVSLSDGTELKMDYRLIPDSLEIRLQDKLSTSSSFLLRLEYVKDALKIWATNPLIGRGLTSTDGLYTAVQSFFYQSMFVHNHVVQYLADLGIVGLAFFLMILVGAVWLLLRKWGRGADPLASAFLACLVMMNLHSAMEINFSVRAYGILAYFLLAVITVAYGEPLLLKGKDTVKRAATLTAVCFWALIVMWAGVCISYRITLYRASDFTTESREEYMDTLEGFIAMDALDDEYYKILYIAQSGGDPAYELKAQKYAQQVRNGGAFTNCDALARYYYMPRGMMDEMFACTREGIDQKASDPESWNGELDFYRATVLEFYAQDWSAARESYLNGVLALRDKLADFNMDRIQPIELTEDNQAFLQTAEQVWQNPNMSDEEAYALLDQFGEAESEQ